MDHHFKLRDRPKAWGFHKSKGNDQTPEEKGSHDTTVTTRTKTKWLCGVCSSFFPFFHDHRETIQVLWSENHLRSRIWSVSLGEESDQFRFLHPPCLDLKEGIKNFGDEVIYFPWPIHVTLDSTSSFYSFSSSFPPSCPCPSSIPSSLKGVCPDRTWRDLPRGDGSSIFGIRNLDMGRGQGVNGWYQ